VGLFGTLNVNLQLTDQEAVSRRAAVSTDSSNIGVRGSLTLYKWLRAEAQCETSANVDGISVSGICNRNSRVALASKWGTLWYGNWDTPLKAGAYGTKADDPFLNTDVFAFQSILSSPGFNYRSSAWKIATDTAIAGFDVGRATASGSGRRSISASAQSSSTTNEFESANGLLSPQLYGAVLNFGVGAMLIPRARSQRRYARATAHSTPAAGSRTRCPRSHRWCLSHARSGRWARPSLERTSHSQNVRRPPWRTRWHEVRR
jgi:hypothetical protein